MDTRVKRRDFLKVAGAAGPACGLSLTGRIPRIARAQDSTIAGALVTQAYLGRTFAGILPSNSIRHHGQVQNETCGSGDATRLQAIFIEAPV